MRKTTLIMVLVCAPLVALAGWWTMNRSFDGSKQALRAEHARQLTAWTTEWKREDAVRKIAAHEEAVKRERVHQQELVAAWGGPTEAPSKNPEFNLRQMLEATARACAPAGTVVTVGIDRFTEFEVSLELNRSVTGQQLAEMAACLMRHGVPYVQSLRFKQPGGVLMELDPRALESVSDWSAALPSQVEKLLQQSDVPPAPGNAPQTSSQEEEQAEVAGDRKRLRQAEEAFNRARQENFNTFNSLIKDQSSAVQLGNVGSAAELDARTRILNENESVLSDVRAFFLSQGQRYGQLLAQQSFDPLLESIQLRCFGEQHDRERPALNKLFDAVAARQRAAKSFVADMRAQWGNWGPSRTPGMIEFQSEGARDAFSRAKAMLEMTTENVDVAMREWNAVQK